jgi:hypothetical protein
VGFYDTTCPNAKALVHQPVAVAFARDAGVAAGLIRLHFHDFFVRVTKFLLGRYLVSLFQICIVTLLWAWTDESVHFSI